MALTPCSTEDAVRSLKAGGVLLLGTDTLPGLHCRADDSAAVQRVIAAKGRPPEKSLLVLAGSVEQARQVTTPWSEAQAEACQSCWPGPFSLILPKGSSMAPEVTGRGATLAIRVPAAEALRGLILAVGVPLVSTSANRADQPPMVDMTAAAREFASEIDGVWGPEPALGSRPVPSALVDLTTAPFQILRPGPEAFPGLSK